MCSNVSCCGETNLTVILVSDFRSVTTRFSRQLSYRITVQNTDALPSPFLLCPHPVYISKIIYLKTNFPHNLPRVSLPHSLLFHIFTLPHPNTPNTNPDGPIRLTLSKRNTCTWYLYLLLSLVRILIGWKDNTYFPVVIFERNYPMAFLARLLTAANFWKTS